MIKVHPTRDAVAARIHIHRRHRSIDVLERALTGVASNPRGTDDDAVSDIVGRAEVPAERAQVRFQSGEVHREGMVGAGRRLRLSDDETAVGRECGAVSTAQRPEVSERLVAQSECVVGAGSGLAAADALFTTTSAPWNSTMV